MIAGVGVLQTGLGYFEDPFSPGGQFKAIDDPVGCDPGSGHWDSW